MVCSHMPHEFANPGGSFVCCRFSHVIVVKDWVMSACNLRRAISCASTDVDACDNLPCSASNKLGQSCLMFSHTDTRLNHANAQLCNSWLVSNKRQQNQL